MILKKKLILIAEGRYEPIEGRMLVFPSHLNLVDPNESSEDRISVSFNVYFRS